MCVEGEKAMAQSVHSFFSLHALVYTPFTRHPEERSDKVGNRDEGSIRKLQKNRP